MTSNMNIHCTELILIQSLDFNFFDPVQDLDQNTLSDIQYHHVTKMKLFVWLISSWIINEYEIFS